MKYTYILSNGKELKLRLTSSECIEIETTHKQSILDFASNESITMMCTFLKYMVKEIDGQPVQNFSYKNAQALFDEMIDCNMTIKQILMDVIFEALVVSGFLAKEDWEEMKTAQTNASKKVTKKAVEKLEQI